MKLLPLIGALLISLVPVQASQTPEELTKPCDASKETFEACLATGTIASSYSYYKDRCELWKAGVVIPPEIWDDIFLSPGSFIFDEDEDKAMINIGIKSALKYIPNCPIKPIP